MVEKESACFSFRHRGKQYAVFYYKSALRLTGGRQDKAHWYYVIPDGAEFPMKAKQLDQEAVVMVTAGSWDVLKPKTISENTAALVKSALPGMKADFACREVHDT